MANRKKSGSERPIPTLSNKEYGTLGLYPIEIVGLKTIERVDNRTIAIEVCPLMVKGDHLWKGAIRVKEGFNLAEMERYLRSLQTYSPSYITELVKADFNGKTPTKLRHDFANQQTDFYGNEKIASKKAMRHTSTKNMAYYVDYIKIADMKGIDYAEKMIGKTEKSQLYSMMRLAIRREMQDFFKDM